MLACAIDVKRTVLKTSQNGGRVKNMALLRDVIFRRGPTFLELLDAEAKKFNLKALNKVTVRFDPFSDNVRSLRTVANLLHEATIFSKNQKCLIKTEILTDRSEQSLTAEVVNGETFIFKCANLNALEILQLLNKHITPLAPVEEELATILSATTTKIKKRK